MVAALARGWTRAHGGRPAGASRMSTARAASPAPRTRSCASSPTAAASGSRRPCAKSDRGALYAQALERLHAAGWPTVVAAPGAIAQALPQRAAWTAERHGDLVYPGTCRPGRAAAGAVARGEAGAVADLRGRRARHRHRLDGPPAQPSARTSAGRWATSCCARADGLWAYQLAVVVDDAAQGVTDIVRGEDLADNTRARSRCAAIRPASHAICTPLVLAADGQKLSKQNGAAPVDTGRPAEVLVAAARARSGPGRGPERRRRVRAEALSAVAPAAGAGVMRMRPAAAGGIIAAFLSVHPHTRKADLMITTASGLQVRRHRRGATASWRSPAVRSASTTPAGCTIRRSRTAAAASSTPARTAASPSASAWAPAWSSRAGTRACRAKVGAHRVLVIPPNLGLWRPRRSAALSAERDAGVRGGFPRVLMCCSPPLGRAQTMQRLFSAGQCLSDAVQYGIGLSQQLGIVEPSAT